MRIIKKYLYESRLKWTYVNIFRMPWLIPFKYIQLEPNNNVKLVTKIKSGTNLNRHM